MKHRFLLLASGSALAAAVFGLTLWVGGEAPVASKNERTLVFDEEHAPPPYENSDITALSSAALPLHGAKGWIYEQTKEGGRVVRVFAEKLEPDAQWTSKVQGPGAHIFMSPQRVLVISAQRGTVYAPDNQPQSGTLEGKVVLTLYECPPGRTVDMTHPRRDVHLTVRFDEPVRFDLGLGQIQTNGPLHVRGTTFEFEGTGLDLVYNEKRQRVERLVVAEGESLRLWSAPAPRARKPAHKRPAPSPITGGVKKAAKKTTKSSTQYYRARLSQDVRVTGGPLRHLVAQNLGLLFSFSRDEKKTPLSSGPPAQQDKGEGRGRTGAQGQAARPSVAAAPTAIPAKESAPRPAAQPKFEDLLVKWTGPLIVEPMHTPPAELVGPEDMFVVFRGAPVRVLMEDEQSMEAAALDYLASSGRVRARGAENEPLLLQWPGHGVVDAAGLTYDPGTQHVRILGPGRLRTMRGEGDRGETAREGLREEDLTITWQRHLDVEPMPAPAPALAKSAKATRGLESLKAATFHGEVRVVHPQFILKSDALKVHTPVPGGAPQIHAAGHVAAWTRTQEDDEKLAIQSNHLQVQLSHAEGASFVPTQVKASGEVLARQPGRTLECGMLKIWLDPEGAEDGAPAPSAPGAPRDVRVTKMVATQHVKVELQDPALWVTAHKLVADPGADQLQMFGTPAQGVRLVRSDGALVAQRIVLGIKSQELHVIGAGSLTLRTEGDGEGKAKGDDTPPGGPFVLTISWKDDMLHEHETGSTRFSGKVRADGREGRDTMLLTCGQLWAQLDPAAGRKEKAVTPTSGFGGVRKVLAQENVVLLATNGQIAPGAGPLTRLSLDGSKMSFDNIERELKVLGAGSMLLEDYRPERADPGAAQPGTMSGRGATLFDWDGGLRMDRKHHVLSLRDRVRMVHRPEKGSDPLTLKCEALDAHLKAPGAREEQQDSGGVGLWSHNDAGPPLRIHEIQADHDIEISSGDLSVTTDHLRYTHKDRTVMLLANEGRSTWIEDASQPFPIQAKQIRWDMAHGRFKVLAPGAAQVSIPK